MFEPGRIAQSLLRGIRLRCPRCGHAPIFRGWFVLLARCPLCGLAFEREPGYFVGAMYVNYAATRYSKSLWLAMDYFFDPGEPS
ncbi:MAG: hypothetical protein HYV92_15375 [Candidatus Rokubacteria bacterium]|nr:hypothetical protein [Candidatus Rokubacteria bacterium]